MNWRALVLTAGGLGALRPAPGTWGSLPPPLLVLGYLALVGSDGLSGPERLVLNSGLVVLVVAGAAACVALGTWAERHWGRTDPSSVVADEVSGQSLALLALPWASATDNAMTTNTVLAAAAFVAFRFFDILKPPPINGIQRLPRGWGVAVDDLVAGVFALIVVQVGARVIF